MEDNPRLLKILDKNGVELQIFTKTLNASDVVKYISLADEIANFEDLEPKVIGKMNEFINDTITSDNYKKNVNKLIEDVGIKTYFGEVMPFFIKKLIEKLATVTQN